MITVLVVDDDPSVRNMVELMLVEKGLSVLTAGSGSEAISLSGRQSGSFHLLLSDIVMADMDGVTLAKTLRASAPDLPVILMSGTSIPSLPPGFGPTRFLSKPFSAEMLMDSIQSLGLGHSFATVNQK
jgi:CheY-like chemotaxis protein